MYAVPQPFSTRASFLGGPRPGAPRLYAILLMIPRLVRSEGCAVF